MRVVSVGDLVTDYYYKDGKILGVNGGMTSHNIIANLSKMGIKTSVFGVCGNDCQGEISIKSLKKLKVDTSNITVLDDVKTRCFHVSYFTDKNGKLSFISKKRCPFCNEKKWYDESLIDTNYIINNLMSDDILVFDNLNNENQEIINKVSNKKIIDLGQYFEFENMDSATIVSLIKNKFVIINFNERVVNFLIKKLNLKNELDLYRTLSPELMTVTKGDEGATFIYNENVYNFELIRKGEVIDSTGAGDSFVASIIKDYINNNLEFNENKFSEFYNNSNKLTYKVVSKMGARGHLEPLFRVSKEDNKCTCDKFIYNVRKQIKRCNININNLGRRVINALNSKAYDELSNILIDNFDSCIFVGTGGSFAGALFASKVVNSLYGCNTYSLYPRDVVFRNNKKVNKIILFSYSGTTNDILESSNNFDKDNVYIITKGDKDKIVEKTGMLKNNIFSYRTPSNKGKERGFLSFEGAVVPAALFLKMYINEVDKNINVINFIEDSISYWSKQIENIIDKSVVNKLIGHRLINIFRGDFTDSACYDLESKIIESGILNCIVHEKKNFSHGRFINYENLNNKFSIYFKQNSTSKYEKELMNYLGDNNLIIESRYNDILAEFDLLIASQFIIYHIGKLLDVDVSKPKYSDEAMSIYFYKGNIL